MLAARQQDPEALRRQYAAVDEIILSIDGLQPEKGHETLYVVRELTRKRVWFAEPLISATADEVRRLITKAKEWAESLGKPVALWFSDRQDAFVTGIAAEFPDVPHRYCDNHFLRDVAKPVLEADSHAKVRMRKKVRGLRTIEQAVLQRRSAEASRPRREAEAIPDAAARRPTGPAPRTAADAAGGVVLDYCTAVRGILNDDQGGPLHPPGLRMAEALEEVRGVDPTEPGREKRGFAEEQLSRLAGCIDEGLDEVEESKRSIRDYVEVIEEVAATLEPGAEDCTERQEKFEALIDRFEATEDPIHQHMAAVMVSFLAGLFVGEGSSKRSWTTSIWSGGFACRRATSGGSTAIATRGFGWSWKGRRWCMRWTRTTATPGRSRWRPAALSNSREPPCQTEARDRRKIMRKARSKTKRPILLAELERRYRETPEF